MSKNAIVIDTNVLIHDPNALNVLKNDGNDVYIPWVVILELDKLKNQRDIGYDAREALKKIENAKNQGDNNIIIIREVRWKDATGLKKDINDHYIIAAANCIIYDNSHDKSKKGQYRKVKLLSRDRTVRLLAQELDLGLIVENYHSDESEKLKEAKTKTINVPKDKISIETFSFPSEEYTEKDKINLNEGVICYSDFSFNGTSSVWEERFIAINKGKKFNIIQPDISASQIKPITINNNGTNWMQHIALGQLLDKSIELVFLQGGAGTGKTLLALASAIELKSDYRQIIIARPMVHLEDKDNMGFLPGDEKDKMRPWIRPINIALSFLKEAGNKEKIDGMIKDEKIIFESLDYIRGMTFYKDLVIVDEAQNLTPHQIKTIITRAGQGTKMIFTGDLGQIDRRKLLDEKSSGLTYATNKLKNQKLVGITNFKETVRSKLASLADKLL